jgi:hypothetical protein
VEPARLGQRFPSHGWRSDAVYAAKGIKRQVPAKGEEAAESEARSEA